MNIDAFRSPMLQSKLFDEDLCVNVDEFADLIDSEVTRQLDVYAPLLTRSRRCGQNDSRWLSTEARKAKRLRRRLERRFIVPGWMSIGRLSSMLAVRHVTAS